MAGDRTRRNTAGRNGISRNGETQTRKEIFMTVRITDEFNRKLKRVSRQLKMSKSEFLRTVAEKEMKALSGE